MKRYRTVVAAVWMAVVTGAVLAGCSHQQARHQHKSADDFTALYTKVTANALNDTRLCLAMLDSAMQTGDYPEEIITMIRGTLYCSVQDFATGEPLIHGVFDERLYQLWPYGYYKSADMLTVVMVQKDHIEGALRIATEALKRLDTGTESEYEELKWNLMCRIGLCHLRLRQLDECTSIMDKGYEGARALTLKTKDPGICKSLGSICLAALSNYMIFIPEQMPLWIARSEESVRLLEQADTKGTLAKLTEFYKARILSHQMQYWGYIGKKKEARKAMEAFMKTSFAKNPESIIDKFNYYYFSQQWDQAADCLHDITDLHYKKIQVSPTLTNLSELGLSFRVYENAGRHAEAMEMARMMAEMVDSVRLHHMQDQSAEMAALYDTKEKDAEIAQQQIALSQQRLIGLAIAIVLLTLFFVIYTLHRRHAAKRLAEVKAAQERIESELRIARNIQMSMVPSVFPEREGLDMFASMTPAKEVGGDLYGYLLQGDKLYFAIGDVSGKGVPASLFMAQATRLFLTLAKQQMMPAEICTRMNDALSGDDNENGMFVTFWLGLLDLQTGHLDFCNAGHNPPIIGGGDHQGDFLQMQPNAPIGLWPGLEYEGEEIATVKGRALFIYTDGLNEAENPQQQQFGDDRLLSILRNTHFESARQVIETLAAEVETHRNGAEPNDDLTMMCLRVK